MGRQDYFVPHVPTVIGDGSQRRIRAIANTGAIDRYRTRIEPRGMAIQDGPLPLLFNHDAHRPVGRIEQIERSDDAVAFEATITDEAMWSLIRSGTVSGVSIGFQPHEWAEDAAFEDVLVCRSWTCCELSICSVPANPQAAIRNMPPLSAAPRVQFIDHATTTPEPTARLVQQIPAAPAVHTARAVPFNAARVWAHMLGDLPVLDGIEREVTTELAKRAPVDRGGLRIPFSVFKPQRVRIPNLGERQISTDPASIGALSPSQYVGALLDDMAASRRWGSLLSRLGFVEHNEERETAIIPKINRRMVATWGLKDAVATESDWTAQDDTVTPRYISVTARLWRSALKYATPSALQFTIDDIASAIDTGTDDGLLYGTGANNMPTGLLLTPGRVVNLAGAPVSFSDLVTLKNDLLDAWRMDQGDASLRWLFNPRSFDALRTTSKKIGPGASADQEWPQAIIAEIASGEGALLGIPVIQSGKVAPTAQAPGVPPVPNYNIDLIYGRMGAVVWFANGSIDTIVDTSTLSDRSAVRVSAFLDCNCVTRDPLILFRLANVRASPNAATGP
jgi:HK97 family phage prohead protease